MTDQPNLPVSSTDPLSSTPSTSPPTPLAIKNPVLQHCNDNPIPDLPTKEDERVLDTQSTNDNATDKEIIEHITEEPSEESFKHPDNSVVSHLSTVETTVDEGAATSNTNRTLLSPGNDLSIAADTDNVLSIESATVASRPTSPPDSTLVTVPSPDSVPVYSEHAYTSVPLSTNVLPAESVPSVDLPDDNSNSTAMEVSFMTDRIDSAYRGCRDLGKMFNNFNG